MLLSRWFYSTDYTYVPCTSGALSHAASQQKAMSVNQTGSVTTLPRPSTFEELVQTRLGLLMLVLRSARLVRKPFPLLYLISASEATLISGILGFEHTWSYIAPCDSNNQTLACGDSNAVVCAAGRKQSSKRPKSRPWLMLQPLPRRK